MKRIERLYQRDHVAITKTRVDETGQRGSRAQRRVPGTHVKLVQKDADDASAARLEPYRVDPLRFARNRQFEIVRPAHS